MHACVNINMRQIYLCINFYASTNMIVCVSVYVHMYVSVSVCMCVFIILCRIFGLLSHF